MEYPFPPEFPQQSRNLVLAERVRAARDFEKAKQGTRSPPAIEGFLRNYILRGFSYLSEKQASWGANVSGPQPAWNRSRANSSAGAQSSPGHEKGYDRSRNRLREMVSHWDGGILPDVQRWFEQSPEWKEYEDILLAVADAPAGPQKDESQLKQAETAGPVGIQESLHKQDETLGRQTARAPVASPNLANIEESREEQASVLNRPSGPKRKPGRRNAKYEAIYSTLRDIAEGRPTSHEEVFRALEGRTRIPNAEPFESAGGWLTGFRRNKIAARAWLSKAWSGLNLPAFPRGPK